MLSPIWLCFYVYPSKRSLQGAILSKLVGITIYIFFFFAECNLLLFFFLSYIMQFFRCWKKKIYCVFTPLTRIEVYVFDLRQHDKRSEKALPKENPPTRSWPHSFLGRDEDGDRNGFIRSGNGDRKQSPLPFRPVAIPLFI